MGRFQRLSALALLCLLVAPVAARAQASIAGVVKDSSGAVLPGVTVEASSPALIEKSRSAVTDGTGQYKIIDLRPGVYMVTFELQGFNTVQREGIELTGNFTAAVNTDLRVGAVAETITVTGETPVVDVQSTSQQQVLGKAVLDSIPSGRSQFNAAALIPGANVSQIDVGGTNTLQLTSVTIHGGRGSDFRLMVDGISLGNTSGAGQNTDFVADTGSTQEVVTDYASGTADMDTGGVRINLVPREGGNSFRGSFFATAVNSSFQASNYSDELKARGLTQPNSLKQQYDFNPSGGGPIVRDRLWFYSSARWQTNQNYVAGIFENLNAGDITKWAYEPDYSRQGVFLIDHDSVNTRLTWQASARNKFSFFVDNQHRTWHNVTPTFTPEAATVYTFPVERLSTASWSSPLTSRLLLSASIGQYAEVFRDALPPEGSIGRKMIGVVEQGGLIPGLTYRSRGINSGPNVNYYYIFMPNIINTAASLSYVTGSHAFKVGYTNRTGGRDFYSYDNDYGLVYRFNNGVPNQIWERATPLLQAEQLNANMGVYLQDKWTLNRLTLNAGVRFEYYDFGFPEQHLGPGPLVPNRDLTFAEVPSWVSFKDLSPRLGGVYDLFGDGKTAIKGSVNRYAVVVGSALNSYSNFGNPTARLANQITRSWNDSFFPAGDSRRGNYWPDCDLLNPLRNDECGDMSDRNFGQSIPTTEVDPAILRGWGVAPYSWEFSASVQHEVMPRVGANVGFFRRIYGNFTVTDNRATSPSDFTPFSIVAPVDPRLPDGGGYTVTGLYNLNPDKVGQVDNYFTDAARFGKQIEHWNGVDAGVNVRLLGGFVLQGGVSTGRTTTDNCDVVTKVDNPSPLYCHVDTNFLTHVKLLGTYTVPRVDLQVAATFQSFPGPQVLATFNAPNALVQPSLGRPLSGGAANTPVPLIAPGTTYGEQANQLDLRLAKILLLGRARAALNIDLYNALNANPVLSQNNTYTTTSWQTPQRILDARLLKISAQFDF